MSEEEIDLMEKSKSETPPPRLKPKKIIIPRRVPSVHVPERIPIYITPDKTTCDKCTCFPKEDPYVKNKKLNPCQKSPKTLYELAAEVVDMLPFSQAFDWSKEEIADWMDEIGFPEYKDCILDNNINGRRLLILEDPSKLAEINIKNLKHIQMIISQVRKLFSTEEVKFNRSIGLPPRKPLTHCTWFKSKTGPSWGVRQNWTRCDILRWMKIIGPEPVYWNHWDLVWYQKPDFPKVLFARVKTKRTNIIVPQYIEQAEVCREYLDPRKFIIQKSIPETLQFIWMEKQPEAPKRPKIKLKLKKESRLAPKKICLKGLSGKEFILAKRKMNKPKFLP